MSPDLFCFSTKISRDGTNRWAPVAQSVACPIAGPEVVSSIPAQPYTFMEIDLGNIFYGYSPLSGVQECQVSVTSKSICTEYW